MDFCDEQGIDFVFGLAGNDVLRRLVESDADDVRVCRAENDAAVIRRSGCSSCTASPPCCAKYGGGTGLNEAPHRPRWAKVAGKSRFAASGGRPACNRDGTA
jgi:hypothetical protein